MAKTKRPLTKREDVIAILIKDCIENCHAETGGKLRDYLGSVTTFLVPDPNGGPASAYKLVFYPNNHVPRCVLEKL